MAITQQQVFEAADALAEQGQRISVRTVRQALGGGSPNEITPYVRAWRETHAEQAREVQALDQMPLEVRQALAEPLEALQGRLWAVLKASTTAELEAMRHSYEAAAQELRGELTDAQALAEDLAGELEQARTTIEAQGQDLEQARRQAQESATRLATLEGRLQAEQERREAAEAQVQALQDRLADLARIQTPSKAKVQKTKRDDSH